MVRVRTKWSNKTRDRAPDEIAGALAMTAWKICCEAVLSLENEGFETTTNEQRLDIIAEFAAFLVHATDRLVFEKIAEDERKTIITRLALHLADTMQDNRVDILGEGDYRQSFIDLMNRRLDAYAECKFDNDEPGFTMRRMVGDYVTHPFGPKDKKWITDYVMDIEVPEAVNTLKRALNPLLLEDRLTDESHLRDKGGVIGED